MSEQRPPAPVNPLPPFLIALFLVLIGVEAAFTLGARGLIGGPDAVGWRAAAIQDYGFNGEILADWGLHLVDMNLAMGNLVELAKSEGAAWHGAQNAE